MTTQQNFEVYNERKLVSFLTNIRKQIAKLEADKSVIERKIQEKSSKEEAIRTALAKKLDI
ncbi:MULTISPECIES: hypothetical protein [Helicobacter]|uniref:Uncharacterized protein n=1 Tax=Helicobacter ibis TaxID=2962633 RepID=A0ABT4VBQ4_9HELI|nr:MULTISPECIES: hypothetical protein [Helicobacter]MDA3966909.1 hypothetical protein [Helicobacter sp. WB40]MDA3968135.1 hypothetical protein [Helicobacter ibis]